MSVSDIYSSESVALEHVEKHDIYSRTNSPEEPLLRARCIGLQLNQGQSSTGSMLRVTRLVTVVRERFRGLAFPNNLLRSGSSYPPIFALASRRMLQQ